MHKLMLAAAAALAVLLAGTPADAQNRGHRGGQGNWHRDGGGDRWRGGDRRWRDDRGWRNGRDWRGDRRWRGDRGRRDDWRWHYGWRDDRRRHFRIRPRLWGGPFWGGHCRSWFWDGWGWRCGW